MKIVAVLSLFSSLAFFTSLASASKKSHKKSAHESHKDQKSSHLRSKTKLDSTLEIPGVEIPAVEDIAPTWIVQTSFGADDTCSKKTALSPAEGGWAYRSFPLNVCVPRSGESSGSVKYEYVGSERVKYITYTDTMCEGGAEEDEAAIGSCKEVASGSSSYMKYTYATEPATDYYAPMSWEYYSSEINCDTGVGEGTGDGTGFAVIAFPKFQCFVNEPITGNKTISSGKTYSNHLEYCTGYTVNDCATASDGAKHVPTCTLLESCGSPYSNKEFGQYWISFSTYSSDPAQTASPDTATIDKKSKKNKKKRK